MANLGKYYAKGDKRRKLFKSSRRSSRSSFFDRLLKASASAAKAQQRESRRREREYNRQVAAHTRLLEKKERELIRQAKQREIAERRAERERIKAERERERAARLQAKLEEQKRFEEEVSDIEEENDLWVNVHRLLIKWTSIFLLITKPIFHHFHQLILKKGSNSLLRPIFLQLKMLYPQPLHQQKVLLHES